MSRRSGYKIRGLQQIQKRLNKEIMQIKERSLGGLIDAAIIVDRDAEQTSPITPLDLGNLRASRFIVTKRGNSTPMPAFVGPNEAELSEAHAQLVSETQSIAEGSKDPLLLMGYSANYAAAVHEMVGEAVNWSRPGSGAKWFEYALKRNRKKIVQAVADKAKVQ